VTLRALAITTLQGCALAIVLLGSGDAFARTLATGTLNEPSTLSGRWKFSVGDDLAWADPTYDDSHWDELLVPGGWGRQGYPEHSGIAWLRLEIDLSQALADGLDDFQLGVQMGEITSSYELFAGGTKVGGVGALPPDARMEYDRHRIYKLPKSSIDDGHRVVLALRV